MLLNRRFKAAKICLTFPIYLFEKDWEDPFCPFKEWSLQNEHPRTAFDPKFFAEFYGTLKRGRVCATSGCIFIFKVVF